MLELKRIKHLLNNVQMTEDLNLKVHENNLNLGQDSLFIAIVGERYNPLEHLDKVVSQKCKYVVYESSEESDSLVRSFKDQIHFFPVSDLEKTIAEIGTAVAEQFQSHGGKIIAISGSNGKTTTKEMLYHLLTNNYGSEQVICTQKNNNNHLGVPFTLFQITEETKYAIVELGSNAPGEIEYLCNMISPNIGVTTNIGDTHLEFFDNRENVFKEEAVLQNYCSEMFFINSDDEYLNQIQNDNKKINFGTQAKNYRFEFTKLGVQVNNFHLLNQHITGRHNFQNLALAFSLAHFLDPDSVDATLTHVQTFKPTANRSEWIKFLNCDVFLDAYNANPSSMMVALDGFAQKLVSEGGQVSEAVVVLGDMYELGRNAESLHKKVGEYALSLGFAHYIFVGNFKDHYCSKEEGNIHKYASTLDAKEPIIKLIAGYKYLFIKGSRSLQLERITDIK